MKNTGKKFVLGTVQLGMNYGINNHVGKPDEKQAFEILDCAVANGVEYIDTAAAYGDAEQIIGKYQRETGHCFKICTKLLMNTEMKQEDDVEQLVNRSLQNFNGECLEILYLHRFEECKDRRIMEALKKIQTQGKAKKLGVSVYEPAELEYIILNLKDLIDVVQIPYNILDSARWDMLIGRAEQLKIEIFSRSVYLQGLLFKEFDAPIVKKLGAEEYVYNIQNLAKKKKVPIAKLLIDFNKQSSVDGILVGCEEKQQLYENLKFFRQENCLKEEDLEQIRKLSKQIEQRVIDPRRW